MCASEVEAVDPVDVPELIEILQRQYQDSEIYVLLNGDIGRLVDVRVDEQAQTITLIGGDI